MCTKKMAFITQRKYLSLGKLCFPRKCTLWKKKNVFFLLYDERQLYWASSKKRMRGNIRKIWNFFSEIFLISFSLLFFFGGAVYNWHIEKDLQLFYYIDHSWELLTLKIAYKHVSLRLRIDQVCDLLIYYIDMEEKKMLEHRNRFLWEFFTVCNC